MQFPPELKLFLRQPGIKGAWVSENKPFGPSSCLNCGGLGYVSIFVATDGPYDSPGNPYQGTPEEPIVSHWSDGKWWIGKTHIAPCPVCHDVRQPAGREEPRAITAAEDRLLDRWDLRE